MNQFAPTHSRTFRHALPSRRAPSMIGGLLVAPLRWAQQAWVQHRDARLLQGLSDTQLRDLGITRGQIQRAVREGLCR